MLLTLLLPQTADKVLFPDVLVAPKPPVSVPVQIMPPLEYTIRRVTKPKETKWLDKEGDLHWQIAGKWVEIKCPKDGRWIFTSQVWPGRDGSVFLEYSIGSEPMSSGSTTLTNLRQKNLIKKAHDPESWYQDPKNFVGCDYEPGILWPESPYVLTQTVGGVKKQLGWGAAVRTWWPDDIVAHVSVDGLSKPSYGDIADHDFLRFYHMGVPTEIGDYRYLGALPNRTLILWRGRSLVKWANGDFLSSVEFPEDWEPVIFNTSGEVLMRHVVTGTDLENDSSAEIVWEMAILSGSRLYPVSFTRPKDAKHLLWRPSEYYDAFDAKRRYRFWAFWGDDSRFYELAPVSKK